MKYRHEIKYICSEAQLAIIRNRISGICKKDKHVNEDGTYRIRSLYFDDYNNSSYYENENGVNPRKKYRIRYYNYNLEHIVLEKKSKIGSKTLKESCNISLEQCKAFLQPFIMLESLDMLPPLLQEFYVECKTKLLRPKIIVEYERVPFIYRDGNVRITFDQSIASSRYIHDFLKPDIQKRLIMPLGRHVLEVKYDEFIPDFLYNVMQIKGMRQSAYSKYYLSRKFS